MRRSECPYAYQTNLCNLLFDDFQNFHGASLDANTAGDALGSNGRVFSLNHNMEGAGFYALAAANAELLVDDIDALCVLGDSTGFAGSSTLAALDANHGLRHALTVYDLDAGLILMKLLVESGRAGSDALQAGHAGRTFFNSQFFHGDPPICIVKQFYYTYRISINQSILLLQFKA